MVIDVESCIGATLVRRSGSACRKVAARIMGGITRRKVRSTKGDPATITVPAKFGLFPSMLGIEVVEVAGQKITLCHYPMRSWKYSYHGAWQLYCHVPDHDWDADLRGSSLTLDVGVVTPHGHAPCSFEEVKDHMQQLWLRFRADREKHL